MLHGRFRFVHHDAARSLSRAKEELGVASIYMIAFAGVLFFTPLGFSG